MIPIRELNSDEGYKVRVACAYMFSPQHAKSNEFLTNLSFDTLKKAYREKSKRYHPDCNRHEPFEMLQKRSERFVSVHDSYKILSSYIKEDIQAVREKVAYKRKIIAVGGAKGGIGKSLFAANLGVLLSGRGRKTVLVDLDLGGANLHLYLGEKMIHKNINGFLGKSFSTLRQIMIRTKYGPLLIGGDSSQLGAANIGFAQKLKLLKAIRNIDADYIIIDLGGDTSYNMIDFFLASDHGIVMTNCDPASYLDAYSFIKTSLYRKLNRLFGPESNGNDRKNDDLKTLIEEFTMSKKTSGIVRMTDFIEKVQREQPHSVSVLRAAISDFRPYLVVNKIPRDFNEAPIVKRIQEVAGKMLSIRVKHFGSIPYHPEIEISASNLIPAVAGSSNNILAGRMDPMVEYLLDG